MKSLLCVLGLLGVMAAGCVSPAVLPPRDGGRLTVELRDGSRVIGTSPDNVFDFHSEILGTVKLPLAKIRAVESLARTNRVEVTTTGGDSLTVAFATEQIRLATSYGAVTLPVSLIKSIRVSAPGTAGSLTDGLIGWWSGEGDAVDAAGGNNGTLQNVRFTDGVVGQAFNFAPNSFPYGTYVGVEIPDRPAYVLTQALTITGWIRPRGDGYMIFFRGDHRPGLDPYCLSMQANHDLRFQICGPANETAFVDALVPYCQWTHVAAVFDGNNQSLSLYTNGVLAAQMETQIRPIGELIPELSPGLGIGNVNDGGNNFPFVGDLDEMALYDRALTPEEVSASFSKSAANASGRAELLPMRRSPTFRVPY